MDIPTAIAILVSAAGIWFGAIAMIVAHIVRAKDAKADREALRAAIDGLKRQGDVLAELIRRTAPPSSQAGPPPGPAE